MITNIIIRNGRPQLCPDDPQGRLNEEALRRTPRACAWCGKEKPDRVGDNNRPLRIGNSLLCINCVGRQFHRKTIIARRLMGRGSRADRARRVDTGIAVE